MRTKDLIWFMRASWRYLGCDAGTGRWRARLRYALGVLPRARWFVAQCKRDRAASATREDLTEGASTK